MRSMSWPVQTRRSTSSTTRTRTPRRAMSSTGTSVQRTRPSSGEKRRGNGTHRLGSDARRARGDGEARGCRTHDSRIHACDGPAGERRQMMRRMEDRISASFRSCRRSGRCGMRRQSEQQRPLLPAAAVVAAAVAVLAATPFAAAALASPVPSGFRQLRTAIRGGSIWLGVIPGATRQSAIYLPPGFTRSRRYPVVYLLHGMPGSPWSYINSLSLGNLSDTLIAHHRARPFIAVMPVAGRTGHYDGEWAGRWEDYLVRRVVPWVDAHLSTIAATRGRTLAGLSAGGYGAVDIGLRHPLVFGRLESWGGYFSPRADLPVPDPGPVAAAAHDPRLLVRREAPLLRRRGTSFFLSTGPGHGRVDARDTVRFARELHDLGLPYHLELFGIARGAWERQLDAGLRWALARVSR